MNPNLKPIYRDFRDENPTIDIKPEFFQIGAIAYLKENNETMELLLKNQEAMEEFKNFIKHVILSKNKDIRHLVQNYLSDIPSPTDDK